MFAIDPNDSFWDTVDDELVKIRTKAQNNPVKITRSVLPLYFFLVNLPNFRAFSYFKAILEADQKAYRGDDPSASYTLPTSVTSADAWQTEVDNLLDGTAAL